MQKRQPTQLDARKIVYLAVFLVIVLHGGLLPFTVGQTYDAYIHMFFGDHYNKSWFDPWEPRWYTGFTVTAYPPGGHQLIGLLLNVFAHKTSFILVQLTAVSILTVGVYRFSRIWVDDFSAALAALLCVASTAIAETLHIFGQLPTTLSLGVFLNATPHIFAWIKSGSRKDIAPALIFTAGATAAHHVTPIFATLLFVAPLGLHAWFEAIPAKLKKLRRYSWQELKVISAPVIRGVLLGGTMLIVIVTVVYPYWYWSITDPITQVSIPHGSRESFIARPDLGLMFFVIPWGLLIGVVPYVAWCVARSKLWPLALSVLFCLFLGTGGTTPFPKIILGPAFDILTLDRFTFWAAIMILPFAGKLAASLLNGRAREVLNISLGTTLTRLFLALCAALYGISGVLVSTLPLIRPTQPTFVDPTPIVQFMTEDNHNNWRYLTLGFGDQFAYHSALIDAYSVDGNYHSARRLPELTSYSVERLENSKYLGVPGLGSLQQFVFNAEQYSLKYIFSNDEFYDPLLYYGGWERLLRLRNGIVVWEKPSVTPIEIPMRRRTISRSQVLMWGTIPPLSLFLAFALMAGLAAKGRLIDISETTPTHTDVSKLTPKMIKLTRIGFATTILSMVAIPTFLIFKPAPQLDQAETVQAYYLDLDRRAFDRAHNWLSTTTRPDYEAYLKILRSRGGLISSYSKLLDIDTTIIAKTEKSADIQTDMVYLTAVGTRTVSTIETVTNTKAGWRITTPIEPKALIDTQILNDISVSRKDLSQSREEQRGTSAFGLDRPQLSFSKPALVQVGNRIRAVGEVQNNAPLPACLDLEATAYVESADETNQRMGVLGAHRLRPGETRPYSIEFEGVLRLQDANLGAGYNPEFFRLPEFGDVPERVTLRATSLYCNIDQRTALAVSDISVTSVDDVQNLQASLTNASTAVASVVQLTITYYDKKGQVNLVEPHWIETNLIPGEKRLETIPLNNGESVSLLATLDSAALNGENSRELGSNATAKITLPDGGPFSAISISIDVMPFEPTF